MLPKEGIQLIEVVHVLEDGPQELEIGIKICVQPLLQLHHRKQPIGSEFILQDILRPCITSEKHIWSVVKTTVGIQETHTLLGLHLWCQEKLVCKLHVYYFQLHGIKFGRALDSVDPLLQWVTPGVTAFSPWLTHLPTSRWEWKPGSSQEVFTSFLSSQRVDRVLSWYSWILFFPMPTAWV